MQATPRPATCHSRSPPCSELSPPPHTALWELTGSGTLHWSWKVGREG